MQQFYNRFLKMAAIGLFVAALVAPAASQTVNITFKVNTATNPDTLRENSVVEIRGALNNMTGAVLPGGKTIDWSSASDLDLTNVGGDYWEITFEMEADDTLKYKIWTGLDPDNGTFYNTGWEDGLDNPHGLEADNNRIFISGSADTTLDLQYYNATGGNVDQFWRPFESKQDTVAIYFRVNMAGVTTAGTFDPAVNGPVGFRGGLPLGTHPNWDTTTILFTREENSALDGSFWSGVGYVPKDSVMAGDEQNYKFFIENKGDIDWEGGDNRSFTYTESLVNVTGDTTLHWDWFNRQRPVFEKPVDATITFRVSTEALEQLEFTNAQGTTKLFDRGLGDEIKVIGPKGWDVQFDLPTDFIDMNFNPLLQEWTATEPFSRVPGTDVIYKYFVRWDTSRVNPNSPNFIPNLVIRGVNDGGSTEDSGWEEAAVTGGGNRFYKYTNDAQQAPEGDFGFDRAFFNSIPANGIIKTPITITWNVDMNPATDIGTNPDNDLFRPETDSVWVQFDGSLFALSQGFETFGTRDILLEDSDGDGIYSKEFVVTPPAPYQIEYVVVYSTATPGTYVQHGGGDQRGRRYYQFVRPTEVQPNPGGQFPIAVWPETFDLPIVEWKSGKNLIVEDPPNLVVPTGINDQDGIPHTFDLSQNYPNPFNPETTIRYQVANNAGVKIQVFNLMGQLVKTLVDQKQAAGNYTIQWNGQNERGQIVSTGVYLLKMQAGDFTKVKKMAFIR
jgi:hypothetical protein